MSSLNREDFKKRKKKKKEHIRGYRLASLNPTEISTCPLRLSVVPCIYDAVQWRESESFTRHFRTLSPVNSMRFLSKIVCVSIRKMAGRTQIQTSTSFYEYEEEKIDQFTLFALHFSEECIYFWSN